MSYQSNSFINSLLLLKDMVTDQAQRPFDVLKEQRGATVTVSLKNGEIYQGTLHSFDIHLNLVLNEATVTVDENETHVGTVLVRGDAIVTVQTQ
jgi:small nuclear ribonucleoprotein